MGEIIASCGHKLTEKEGFGKNIIIEDWDRENKKCETSMVVCKKCYKIYKRNDWILRELK